MRTILERLALSVGFGVTTVLAIWAVLRTRTRLRGKLEALPPSFLKEPDAIYRDGRVIAHVEGATVDEGARSVHFEHLTSTVNLLNLCLLYTSDAADERSSVDLGGRRI